MADELEHGELVKRAEPAIPAHAGQESPVMIAARRVHAAYHAGGSKADAPELAAIAYVQALGEQWGQLSRLRRRLLTRLGGVIVRMSWGARFCDPDARYPICDERT